jgi:hypothetical protein
MAEPKDKDTEESLNIRIKRVEQIQAKYKELEVSAQKLAEIEEKGGNELKTKQEAVLNLISLGEKRIQLEKEEVLLNYQIAKQKKELTAEEEKKYEQQLQNLQNLEEELQLKKEITEETVNFGKASANTFSSITGIGAKSNTILGSMIQLSGKGGTFSEAMLESYQQIAKMITPANLLAAAIDGIINQTKKLFLEMDQAFSEFEKTAGGVDAFKGRIEDLRSSNVQYALSIKEASVAFSELKVNFAGFAGVSKLTQDQLATTTAQMTKLGVSSSETIKIQNMLVKGFQMTGEQAGNMQKQLMATAKSMGLPMQKVVGEFANASNNLKAHGSNMQKVFLDLQNQSKNLGIEFTKLQQITGKFDTFDDAAESAGKLNAILGGDYLNSLDMVNADEAERVRLMQEALKNSGKTFDMMSKQEAMAVQQALGLESVTELQQMMNNEVQQGTVESLSKAEAEKELAQSVKDVTTMQEKLTAIMAQFAIVMIPVLDTIKGFLDFIAEGLSKIPKLGEGIGYLAVGLGVLASAFVAARLAYVAFGAFQTFRESITAAGGGIKGFISLLSQKITAQKAATKATEELGKSQEDASKKDDGGKKIAKTIENIGEAAKKSWKEILAFGGAVALIGLGVAIAARGLAELVKSFSQLTGKEIAGALGGLIIVMGGFAIMLKILAGASLAAAKPLLAVGGAIALIGLGIGIAALGLSVMVRSFAGLGENALPAALAIGLLAGSIVLITFALAPAIPAIAGAGVAFGAAAPGILAFGGAIALVGAGVGIAALGVGFLAKSVGDMFEKISKSKPDVISGAFTALFDDLTLTNISKFATFASKTDELADSLNNLSNSLSTVVTNMKLLSSMQGIFNAPSVTTTNIVPTMSPATAAATAATNTAATKTQFTGNNNAASSGQTNLIPVAIYIDSKKVGEILDPRVKQTIQDSLKNINGRIVPIT